MASGGQRRVIARVGLGALLLGCPAEPGSPRSPPRPASAVDPGLACVHAHPVPERWRPIVRAMCSELRSRGGVSVAVAIARGDEIEWSLAIGPRCRGSAEPLRPTTTLHIGSITKLVTAAAALLAAEQRGVELDEPLPSPMPGAAPTLRSLLQHTSGLRDPETSAMLSAGEAWPTLLAEHRVAPGAFHYANANYLLVGRWLEQVTGRPLPAWLHHEPRLAALAELVAFDPHQLDEPGCSHLPTMLGWSAWPLGSERPLPASTLPAGGGLASAEQLARLPAALARTAQLERMIAAPLSTDQPGTSYGLGVRMLSVDGERALAHAGQTAGQWAELQWSPATGVAVAVIATTPQPFRATTLAAFEAASSSTQAEQAPALEHQ
ncbi:MAG: beta-lactamase family protein [Myxococcales bacterium]|nr:beta-lactamase family protein [Myxococcales bacterium]